MKPEIKKLLILNAPYLLFVYLFDKVGQAVRLAPGADMSAKLLSIGDGFSAAFSNAFPSVHPADLLIGLAGAVIVRLAVYFFGDIIPMSDDAFLKDEYTDDVLSDDLSFDDDFSDLDD